MNGVTFNEKHSYQDWGLFLKDRPEITSPAPNLILQEVPGMDGQLDLSEAVGPVTYKNRKLKCILITIDKRSTWTDTYSEMMNYVNGNDMIIRLDEDPGYYYKGRVQVKGLKAVKGSAEITIEADLSPYKLKNSITEVTENITGQKDVICNNLRRPVVPQVINNAEFTLKFGDNVVTIQPGTHTIPDLLLVQGRNVITCVGTGKITFKYQEGGF